MHDTNVSNPIPLRELKQLRKVVRNINIEHREKLSTLEEFALVITEKVGSMGFFFAVSLWTILWFGWNFLASPPFQFDPYPAFVLWLFISNVLQLILLPLVMVAQNLENRHSEARADADYELSIKSEREIEVILAHLERQNTLILKIVEHLEKEKKSVKKPVRQKIIKES